MAWALIESLEHPRTGSKLRLSEVNLSVRAFPHFGERLRTTSADARTLVGRLGFPLRFEYIEAGVIDARVRGNALICTMAMIEESIVSQ